MSEGRFRLGELAESVFLTSNGIIRLVDRMVEAGLVSREEPCPGDCRGYDAVLTRPGRDTLMRVGLSQSRKTSEVFLNHVKPDEISVLRNVFNRVLETQGEKTYELRYNAGPAQTDGPALSLGVGLFGQPKKRLSRD